MPGHAQYDALVAPGPAASRQPRRGGSAFVTGADASAPAAAAAPPAGRPAPTVCRVDLATGVYAIAWHLFLFSRLAKPLAGRELLLYALRLVLLAVPTLSIWLAPRAWLRVRRVLIQGQQGRQGRGMEGVHS